MMRETVSDVMFWLGCEFREMFGRGDAGFDRPLAAILRLGRDGIGIEPPPGRKKPEPAIVANAGEAVDYLTKSLPRKKLSQQSVFISVGPDRYLYRKLSDLRLPKSKLEAMARLDMNASTPFPPDEVHLVCSGLEGKSDGSGYFIIKRAMIDPLIAALKAANISIADVNLAPGPSQGAPATSSNLGARSLSHALKVPFRARFMRGIAMILAFVFGMSLALTAGHAHLRYRNANQAIDAEIATAQTESKAVRQLIAARNEKISQITTVREQKQSAVPVAMIVEEMARIIPDSAFLLNISIQDDTVTFTGLAKSAASLIPVLEASPLFKGPTFKSPVVRAREQNAEQFTITMSLEAKNG